MSGSDMDDLVEDEEKLKKASKDHFDEDKEEQEYDRDNDDDEGDDEVAAKRGTRIG